MRLMILAAIACLLGVQFQCDGFSFGALVHPEKGVSGSTAP